MSERKKDQEMLDQIFGRLNYHENLKPVRPWQNPPVCLTCGSPSEGIVSSTGFFCADHYEVETEAEYNRLDYSTGYTAVRQSWSYWLGGFFWRPFNRVVLPIVRNVKRRLPRKMYRSENGGWGVDFGNE